MLVPYLFHTPLLHTDILSPRPNMLDFFVMFTIRNTNLLLVLVDYAYRFFFAFKNLFYAIEILPFSFIFLQGVEIWLIFLFTLK